MIYKRLSVLVLAFCLTLTAGGAGLQEARAEEDGAIEVGLITLLRGAVEYQKGGAGGWIEASRFMKVRLGDSFHLSSEGKLRIVYFKDGRVETWAGPSEFSLSREGGKLRNGQEPQISVTDTQVSREIKAAPNLLRRSGVWVSRSSGPAMSGEERERILARYRRLKETVGKGDPLPELYLFTTLVNRGEFSTAERYIREALREEPGNPELLEMLSFFGGGK